MRPFAQASLSNQFLLISFPVLVTGMLVIGYLIGKQIQESVLHRKGMETGVYVLSFVEPHLQTLLKAKDLTAADRTALQGLLTTSPLGREISAFNIWHPDGRVLYSADPSLEGRRLPIAPHWTETIGGTGRLDGLAEAAAGRVHAEIIKVGPSTGKAVNPTSYLPRLVETYIPVRKHGTGEVMAIAEFYEPVDELVHASTMAQLRTWMVVAPTTAAMYLLLFMLVHRGSRTIERQQRELNEKVEQLTLHNQVRRAAASTTALNEIVLRRISADLHDGPGQDLGFALMRFETITDFCSKCRDKPDAGKEITAALQPIQSAVKSALTDLRSISAELRMPEIDQLPGCEIAARAIRDYESKTGVSVALFACRCKQEASLPVKIALYRVLQESLANGFRHAAGAGQRVEIREEDNCLIAEISDQGPGFDPHAAARKGRLGLVGMRERVEMLGGSFELQSKPGEGTMIRVKLPLVVPEVAYE